eukprot:SAG31_NODE_2365_length_5859_cov_22.319097_5_plen_140_part_00
MIWHAPCARSVHSRTVLVRLSWATCPSVTYCVSHYAPASKLNIKFGILTIIAPTSRYLGNTKDNKLSTCPPLALSVTQNILSLNTILKVVCSTEQEVRRITKFRWSKTRNQVRRGGPATATTRGAQHPPAAGTSFLKSI